MTCVTTTQDARLLDAAEGTARSRRRRRSSAALVHNDLDPSPLGRIETIHGRLSAERLRGSDLTTDDDRPFSAHGGGRWPGSCSAVAARMKRSVHWYDR